MFTKFIVGARDLPSEFTAGSQFSVFVCCRRTVTVSSASVGGLGHSVALSLGITALFFVILITKAAHRCKGFEGITTGIVETLLFCGTFFIRIAPALFLNRRTIAASSRS